MQARSRHPAQTKRPRAGQGMQTRDKSLPLVILMKGSLVHQKELLTPSDPLALPKTSSIDLRIKCKLLRILKTLGGPKLDKSSTSGLLTLHIPHLYPCASHTQSTQLSKPPLLEQILSCFQALTHTILCTSYLSSFLPQLLNSYSSSRCHLKVTSCRKCLSVTSTLTRLSWPASLSHISLYFLKPHCECLMHNPSSYLATTGQKKALLVCTLWQP